MGRFLAGLFVGIMNFCYGKALNETVPLECSSAYGMLVNSGICCGIFLSGTMGLIIPLESLEELKTDQNWKIVWGVTIFMEAFSIVFVSLFIKSLSLKSVI